MDMILRLRVPVWMTMLGLCLLASGRVWAQVDAVQVPAPAAATVTTETAVDDGCCGPITPGGLKLMHFLDGMDVDHLWQASVKVDWETGRPKGGSGSTHCSAFAAAVGERLGIYMLRPPQHPQDFLASAQGRWFTGSDAAKEGWFKVNGSVQAQALANLGNLVVLVYINPDPHTPGHIAIVRPAVKSAKQLEQEGPQTTQAGAHNFSSGTAVFSFVKHPGAWPNNVLIYAHMTKFATGS